MCLNNAFRSLAMNRKDTIIIAVLINAGLLVVLFASALRTDTPNKAPVQVAQAAQKCEIEMPKRELKRVEPTPPKPLAPAVIAKKEEPAPVKPAEPPKPVVAKKPEMTTIVVQSGDALEKIARRHGVTVKEIMAANHLKSAQLKIGQELKVPVAAGKPPRTSEKLYTVRSGDSPWTIASKNKIKLEELLKLNDLDEASAKKLKPGDTLRIE